MSCFQFRECCADCTLDVTCALTSLTFTCCTSLVVTSHDESQAKVVIHRRDSFVTLYSFSFSLSVSLYFSSVFPLCFSFCLLVFPFFLSSLFPFLFFFFFFSPFVSLPLLLNFFFSPFFSPFLFSPFWIWNPRQSQSLWWTSTCKDEEMTTLKVGYTGET